jgi:hypothetical protein
MNSLRQETASSSRKQPRPREGADDGADSVARGPAQGRLRFQPRRPAPSLPHQAPASAQRTQASQGVETQEELPLDPLENTIGRFDPFAKSSTEDQYFPRSYLHANPKRSQGEQAIGFDGVDAPS